MNENLIIDGNAVYEIDADCVRKMEEQRRQEEERRIREQERMNRRSSRQSRTIE